jgi:hypothetical protein
VAAVVRTTPLVATAFLFVLADGCHKQEEDELGMKVQKVEVVALDKLTDPAQLVVALAQPGDVLDGKLGARGLDLTETTQLAYGGAHDRVDEKLTLDLDGKGAFHLLHDLDHPEKIGFAVPKGDGDSGPREPVDVAAQGMEAVALGGQLYVRPRYGKFIARRPEAGELDRLRELAERRLADDLELLKPFVAISDAGAGSALGRPTHKLALALASPPQSSKAESPQKAWRDTMKVTKLDGTLELDAATGAPMSAKLDAEYTVPREAGVLTTRLTLVLASRAATAITAPPDAAPAPRRPRPMVERNQLLDGLAAPAGTQASRPQ